LVFAGADTTSSAAISIWLLLSRGPGLKAELARRIDQNQEIESFVQQVLEAFPPAPFNMRETQDELVVDGYRIPPKWLVAYGYAAALDGTLPPSPPLPPADSSACASSSVAFGQGPRKCPGRYLAASELKVFTAELVKREWEFDPKQNLEQTYTPGFFPVDGFKVRNVK